MTSNPSSSLPVPDTPATLVRLGSVVVCALAGDLTLDNERQVRRTLHRAVLQTDELVAVDCSNVTLFTASALNALLAARSRAVERDVALVLAAPRPHVLAVLEATDTAEALPLYLTLEHAVAHAGAAPSA
ncbi:STAS domain-containing protein [Streptomyces sp. NPDC058740]|uniref:STAS domain-containing protein n=1 Tax=Streptomyces sp. NPDC058740 TaxID=3346619 RepID=UPI00368A97CD